MAVLPKDELARVLTYNSQQLQFYMKPVYYNVFYWLTVSLFGIGCDY